MARAQEVARSLLFAKPMLKLADRIVRAMTKGVKEAPNGLHLRIEGDAKVSGFFSFVGGEQVRL